MATIAVPGAMWLMLTSRIMGEMYHGMVTVGHCPRDKACLHPPHEMARLKR
jgi:hypothetical protein